MKPFPNGGEAPSSLKWAVRFLSVLLTLLFIFLLNFALSDIGDIEGPNRQSVFDDYVDQSLVERKETLNEEIRSTDIQIQRQREIQQTLQASMDNARETMNQMVSLYRLSLEQNIKPNETEQNALAESQTRFLDAQDRFETANNEISASNQKKHELNQELISINKQIEAQQKPAYQELNRLDRAHRFKVAAFKLSFIVPLFVLAAFLVYRFRGSAFRPVFFAALVATFWQLGVVMFHHFPRQFFHYIAVGAAIAIVLVFLIWVLKKITRPDVQTLIHRYRESYVKHLCPVCAYPITQGAFKYATWSRKGPKLPFTTPPEKATPEEARYACPSCGTLLFEKCENCGEQRHSLLPFCDQCGEKKELTGIA